MYEIEFTEAALADLKWFKKHEQNMVLDGFEANLRYEPMVETRNRALLRPNQTGEWKLRLGNFRVYSDVETVARLVSIEAIGMKIGNLVLFRGKQGTYENSDSILPLESGELIVANGARKRSVASSNRWKPVHSHTYNGRTSVLCRRE